MAGSLGMLGQSSCCFIHFCLSSRFGNSGRGSVHCKISSLRPCWDWELHQSAPWTARSRREVRYSRTDRWKRWNEKFMTAAQQTYYWRSMLPMGYPPWRIVWVLFFDGNLKKIHVAKLDMLRNPKEDTTKKVRDESYSEDKEKGETAKKTC